MRNIDQAVIFAGGRGERLRPLTDHLPKPMAPVNGVPFLDYLIKTIEDAGISKILFLLGYCAQTIVNRYGKYLPSGIQVKKVDFKEDHFRGKECIRLKQISYLTSQGQLNPDLRWVR